MGFGRKMGVAEGRNLPLPRGAGKRCLTNNTWELFQTSNPPQTATLNCLFLSNTFLPRTYYYYRISELAKICLQNRYFEQQIHWVPLLLHKSLPVKRAKKRCDIKQQHSKQAKTGEVERNYKIFAYPVFINLGRPSTF